MSVSIESVKGMKNPVYPQCIFLRNEVFVLEQNIAMNLERDDKDEESFHYLLKYCGNACSTARYRYTDDGIKLERFACLKNYRGKGFGKMVLDKILEDIKMKQKLIYLHAQETAVSFYLANNFIIKGEPFVEANIKHYKMVYVKQKS